MTSEFQGRKYMSSKFKIVGDAVVPRGLGPLGGPSPPASRIEPREVASGPPVDQLALASTSAEPFGDGPLRVRAPQVNLQNAHRGLLRAMADPLSAVKDLPSFLDEMTALAKRGGKPHRGSKGRRKGGDRRRAERNARLRQEAKAAGQGSNEAAPPEPHDDSDGRSDIKTMRRNHLT